MESSGAALLPAGTFSTRGLDISGFPVIQFEGHVFWRRLKALHDSAYDPAKLLDDPATPLKIDSTGKPIGGKLLGDVLYPSMDLTRMRRQPDEWDQLTAARAIHPQLADESASWGAFQIMGFNWKICGRASIEDFVETAHTLPGQLELFVGFIKANPKLITALRNRDWKSFAVTYNGAAAIKNGYDRKLARAWERFG